MKIVKLDNGQEMVASSQEDLESLLEQKGLEIRLGNLVYRPLYTAEDCRDISVCVGRIVG